MRIQGTENWFIGLTYQFLQSTPHLQDLGGGPEQPDVPRELPQHRPSGPADDLRQLGQQLLPAERRTCARVSWLNFGSRWGGDFEFDKIDAFYNHYLPLDPSSLLALRVRLQDAAAATPFFALPTLDMRGFSDDHCRANDTVSFTAEWRHESTPRWAWWPMPRPAGSPQLAQSWSNDANHQDRRQRRALAGDGRARHERWR